MGALDLVERLTGVQVNPPAWLIWAVLVGGFAVAAWLTYHDEVRTNRKLRREVEGANARPDPDRFAELVAAFVETGQVLLGEEEPNPEAVARWQGVALSFLLDAYGLRGKILYGESFREKEEEEEFEAQVSYFMELLRTEASPRRDFDLDEWKWVDRQALAALLGD